MFPFKAYQKKRGVERRKRERARLAGLSSRLGELVDFSEDGFCLIHRGAKPPKVGQLLDLILTYNSQRHTVQVAVVREQALGGNCTELGLEIVEAGGEARAFLKHLAAAGNPIGSGPQAWRAAG